MLILINPRGKCQHTRKSKLSFSIRMFSTLNVVAEDGIMRTWWVWVDFVWTKKKRRKIARLSMKILISCLSLENIDILTFLKNYLWGIRLQIFEKKIVFGNTSIDINIFVVTIQKISRNYFFHSWPFWHNHEILRVFHSWVQNFATTQSSSLPNSRN